MGRRWKDLTPAEQDEEWRYWKEKQENSFANRLWDAYNDAWKPVENFLNPFHSEPRERTERDYRDYRWRDSSGDGEDTKNWWKGCLVLLGILTFPYSLYFIVGLFAIAVLGVFLGLWGLYLVAEQLVTLLLGL